MPALPAAALAAGHNPLRAHVLPSVPDEGARSVRGVPFVRPPCVTTTRAQALLAQSSTAQAYYQCPLCRDALPTAPLRSVGEYRTTPLPKVNILLRQVVSCVTHEAVAAPAHATGDATGPDASGDERRLQLRPKVRAQWR